MVLTLFYSLSPRHTLSALPVSPAGVWGSESDSRSPAAGRPPPSSSGPAHRNKTQVATRPSHHKDWVGARSKEEVGAGRHPQMYPPRVYMECVWKCMSGEGAGPLSVRGWGYAGSSQGEGCVVMSATEPPVGNGVPGSPLSVGLLQGGQFLFSVGDGRWGVGEVTSNMESCSPLSHRHCLLPASRGQEAYALRADTPPRGGAGSSSKRGPPQPPVALAQCFSGTRRGTREIHLGRNQHSS